MIKKNRKAAPPLKAKPKLTVARRVKLIYKTLLDLTATPARSEAEGQRQEDRYLTEIMRHIRYHASDIVELIREKFTRPQVFMKTEKIGGATYFNKTDILNLLDVVQKGMQGDLHEEETAFCTACDSPLADHPSLLVGDIHFVACNAAVEFSAVIVGPETMRLIAKKFEEKDVREWFDKFALEDSAG